MTLYPGISRVEKTVSQSLGLLLLEDISDILEDSIADMMKAFDINFEV